MLEQTKLSRVIQQLIFFVVNTFCLTAFLCDTAIAAVTEVSVAQGHVLYGVEHTLKKGRKKANHPLVTGSCVSAVADNEAEVANRAALHVGELTQLGGGRYRFNLRADYTAKKGTYRIRFRDGNLAATRGVDKNLLPELVVKVREMAVIGVSFLEGQPAGLGIRMAGPGTDTVSGVPQALDSIVTSYEWSNGIKNQPGAYVREGIKKLKVKLHGPANTTYRVWATGDWGGLSVETVKFDANGTATSGVSPTTGAPPNPYFQIGEFPSVVTKKVVAWQWKMSRQGQDELINSTSHKIFVVDSEPISDRKYVQLYEFGCGWADGRFGQENVRNKIWDFIDDKYVALNGDVYSYWGPLTTGRSRAASNNFGYFFVSRNGQCGAWMTFLSQVLAVQGIDMSDFPLRPIPYSGGTRDIVETSTDPDTGRLIFRITYSGPTAVTSLTVKNITAQGSAANPGTPVTRLFRDHAINHMTRNENGATRYKFYDPSYGNGPYVDSTRGGALNAWENESIESFRLGFQASPSRLPTIGSIVENSSALQVEGGEAWRSIDPNEPVR